MKNLFKIFLFLFLIPLTFSFLISLNLSDEKKGDHNPESEGEYDEESDLNYNFDLRDLELSAQAVRNAFSEISKLPSEENFYETTNSWKSVGPAGEIVRGTTDVYYSGRTFEIEINNGAGPLFCSDRAGLWDFNSKRCLSDNLLDLIVSSIASKPGDTNTIFVGTGEFLKPEETGIPRTGSGLYKTTNRGISWINISLNPTPLIIPRLDYEPSNPDRLHLASDKGYFRSTDGGNTWTRNLAARCWDIAFHPTNNSVIFIASADSLSGASGGGGIYKTTNGGNNWTKLHNDTIPNEGIVRASITIAKTNPDIIYALFSKSGSPSFKTIKSTNAGIDWTDITSSSVSQVSNFTNLIRVSPLNPDLVYICGGGLYKSTDGGINWTGAAFHHDNHYVVFSASGDTIWDGSDGGPTYSTNHGVSWISTENKFPTFLTLNCDVSKTNPNIMVSAEDDNGITITTDGGLTWKESIYCDGSGIRINPFNSDSIYGVGSLTFTNYFDQRRITTNRGVTWDTSNWGVTPNVEEYYVQMRANESRPLKVYNNSGPNVYYITDWDGPWTKLNPVNFQCKNIRGLRLSAHSPTTGTAVYAALDTIAPGVKLQVYDNGTWYERGSGLPPNIRVRNVATHVSNTNVAFALMDSTITGQSVFKTTNLGINWINISGNLPGVIMMDLVTHPTNDNILYLGTQYGCYKTVNGGSSWMRWTNGMPGGALVMEMVYIDSSSVGKFYVILGTRGRSMWIREGSGDDPLVILEANQVIPDSYTLFQNYPNPFNPVTTIRFEIPERTNIKIVIYDITGREIKTLVDQNLQAGKYKTFWNASNYSSGTYFYKMETQNFVTSKKLILIK